MANTIQKEGRHTHIKKKVGGPIGYRSQIPLQLCGHGSSIQCGGCVEHGFFHLRVFVFSRDRRALSAKVVDLKKFKSRR